MAKNELIPFANKVNLLSREEKKRIVDRIVDMMQTHVGTEKKECVCSDNGRIFTNARPDCPHCGARGAQGYTTKRGFKNDAQRYYCKSCGRYFFATTGTAFERTRKDADTWKKFIELTISGARLKDCMAECGLAAQTAFNWRHKVMEFIPESKWETLLAEAKGSE